ncbi:DUF4041 domain-containing protein [Paludisphaera rhizosphaerae]|uniref:DUF4041 domain-containing protein n=1 Tax=Paludisphaera rhizosphaerae TaxID=2711216 RepID=UPI00197D6570|nr:DUF4041 domain-containing protein [Paludisphaera rhizosphaerae]
MFNIGLCLITFALAGVALFYFFKSRDLDSRLRRSGEIWEEKEGGYIEELAKLDMIRHIPDIIDRARRTKSDVEARLADAQKRADEIIQRAVVEAQEQGRKLRADGERELEAARLVARGLEADAGILKADAQRALRLANEQAKQLLDEAEKEARELASKTRKDSKEKREKTESALEQATRYALSIRLKADEEARAIAGEAYDARGKVKDLQAVAQALQNRIEKYEGVYPVPAAHVLDELAEEFGFSKAGEKLKLARERTRLMQANGTAASCGYTEGWKKEHALKFVLGTFNGKVDTILSRLKAGNQGKLTQEIKDAYALVNKDGEVYKNARIQPEYLDSRLEEVKWGAAVQKIKEKAREEQRAIREQIREEERAKKEIAKAIKQAEREEELVNKAIAKVRKQFEEASGAEKARFEAELQELGAKLTEAEEKGRRAISMAQQTKKGNVYIISNIGSFGEGVYKVGMTRRLDPTERVRELGDASVPFPFDVHAMISSEDAPALETALHRRFVERQVNKINRRREFFRAGLQELRDAVEEMGAEAVWTIEAEAAQYRETLALEQAMQSDAGLRRKWMEEQATFRFDDESLEDADQELEEVEA